ncbi:MAG: amidohydrolase family protein [Nitrospirae bacterium]|nr:amidohydrolase family protein [Nitrospirota bacterium]
MPTLLPTLVLALALLLGGTMRAQAAELPLFDAHIHYNHDAWESVPPKEAIARLRKAGVLRALVSSSSDDGTQKLYIEAPDLIVPELRPYRKNGEASTWFRDESVICYLQDRLKQYRYVAIGEFHVSGAHADLPVVRRIVQLAKEHGLMLHAHSDADAVERLFRQDPEARIIWAHAGYEKPSRVREMLRRYQNLWPELSSRDDIASNGRLSAEWHETLLEFSDRFMVGTDTHMPERWNIISPNADLVRAWLAELPAEVAECIAYKNGEALLTAEFLRQR